VPRLSPGRKSRAKSVDRLLAEVNTVNIYPQSVVSQEKIKFFCYMKEHEPCNIEPLSVIQLAGGIHMGRAAHYTHALYFLSLIPEYCKNPTTINTFSSTVGTFD
jgi:hypothetical protein